jgi:hypothetical protein
VKDWHKCSEERWILLVAPGKMKQNTETIIIIIIRHQLGLDRPVSTSSSSILKGLPSRLRTFGL